MKRDAIFYTIFQRFPGLLFELVDRPPDQAQRYRFESIEVKEPTFRIDGVFIPPDDASPRIVFFAEFQFQPDSALYDRFFAEAHLYLYRNPNIYDDWQGIIIFPSRNLEPANTTLHRSLLTGTQIQRIYLNELGNPDTQSIGISLIQLTIADQTQTPLQAQRLLQRVQQEDLGVLSRAEIIDVVTTIAVYKFTNLSRTEVEAMLGVNLTETRVYQEAKTEGQLEIVLRLLTRRLRSLDETLEAQVRQLASSQLADLSEALLDFSTVAELETWLQSHAPQ